MKNDAALDCRIVQKHLIAKLVEPCENLIGNRLTVDPAVANEHFTRAPPKPGHAQCFVDQAVCPCGRTGIALLEGVDLAHCLGEILRIRASLDDRENECGRTDKPIE